jgi:hypothetical protein
MNEKSLSKHWSQFYLLLTLLQNGDDKISDAKGVYGRVSGKSLMQGKEQCCRSNSGLLVN